MSSTVLLRHRTAVSERQYRLHLEGEADFSSGAELEAALGAIDLATLTDVRIDASRLTFVDLDSVRRIVDFATGADRAGVSVTVEHAPHALVLVLGQLRAGPLRVV